jgi:hypothetical protein
MTSTPASSATSSPARSEVWAKMPAGDPHRRPGDPIAPVALGAHQRRAGGAVQLLGGRDMGRVRGDTHRGGHGVRHAVDGLAREVAAQLLITLCHLIRAMTSAVLSTDYA